MTEQRDILFRVTFVLQHTLYFSILHCIEIYRSSRYRARDFIEFYKIFIES